MAVASQVAPMTRTPGHRRSFFFALHHRSLDLLERGRLGRLLPWLIFFLALGGTCALWLNARNASRDGLREEFRDLERETLTRIERRMQAHEQVLRGAMGLFASSPEPVTRRTPPISFRAWSRLSTTTVSPKTYQNAGRYFGS